MKKVKETVNPWIVIRQAPQWIPMLLLVFVVGIAVTMWHRLTAPGALPLTHVSIKADANYIPRDTLTTLVKDNLHGGFFSLDIAGLREGLSTNPWVQSVGIRRVWPNTVTISIKEYKPVAQWGRDGVLATTGDILYPSSFSLQKDIPTIDAPLEVKDTILPIFSSLQKMLTPLSLNISKLDVSPRLAWTVTLSNGIVLSLCRGDIKSRFNEFVHLYPRLIGNNSQNVISASLCYPNGLAIRWKNAPPAVTSAS